MGRNAVNIDSHLVPVPGFSHAVGVPAAGRIVFVSGLTARGADGDIIAEGDVLGQTWQVLSSMATVLRAAGGSLDDVVQIRTFVIDLVEWPQIESAYREFWSEPWPASTIVEVNRLYDPRQLIEMEAVAVLSTSPTGEQVA